MKLPTTVIDIDKMIELAKAFKADGEKTGFVPTMGALHEGHLELVKKARSENDRVVVSIFVNPTQFGPNEDFEKYPRALEEDMKALAPLGVDAVFVPNAQEFYPEGFQTYVSNTVTGDKYCGASRPGHFTGVCTVLLKFFHMIFPDKVYMGLKDYQQYLIVRRMVTDLNLTIDVVGVPTFREEDGLAYSSRNRRLTREQRELAVMMPVALNAAYDLWDEGSRSRRELERAFVDELAKVPDFRLDYVKVCDKDDLTAEDDKIVKPVVMLAAAWLGDVRLIDNIEFEWSDT